ncbi:NgoPII family restriction endonuclease [Fibrobacter sp.]|uniref:NgoPII family restriction endonuclease n=1 Tax=Fibrobacter sp. TaxID=35828 RepID=UPI0038670232
MSNIIDAIINLINHNNFTLRKFKDEGNKATKGKDLEEYVKDMFANTFDKTGEDRNKELLNIFSYTGNNKNPPDLMLKGGGCHRSKKNRRIDKRITIKQQPSQSQTE